MTTPATRYLKFEITSTTGNVLECWLHNDGDRTLEIINSSEDMSSEIHKQTYALIDNIYTYAADNNIIKIRVNKV